MPNMNVYERSNEAGMSGSSLDRWAQRSDNDDDSPITKMQHHFWVTKQTLSRKLGKKEDECIIASDAELDAKLELFRSIQDSCAYLQRVIDKYQERLCNLAQEENAMGRFLKEAGKQDKTRAGKMMSAVGKSLSYSGQQRLTLRGPLVRLYQEVETFRQCAIQDTLQTIQAMEKSRTEYRAALSWMKNVSQELDPDTCKQLQKFRKVQSRVKLGKRAFDRLALDCLQKIDLLAAARCNMFSHALVLYQNTILGFTKKSAQAYSTIANSFKGYQRYDFMVVRELAETSLRLAQETGGDDDLDLDEKEKLLFLEEYHDVEEAQEAEPKEQEKKPNNDEQLLDMGESASSSQRKTEKDFYDLFDDLRIEKNKLASEDTGLMEMRESIADLNFTMESLSSKANQGSHKSQNLEQLSSENAQLLNDILSEGPSVVEWDAGDTFLPSDILKQSLGDILNPQGKGDALDSSVKNKSEKQKKTSWMDLFAELDPLNSSALENLTKDSNAA